MHKEVRRLCMDYVAKNRDHFSQFVTEDFNEYLARKRRDFVHGNHVELQAMSEIFLRPIEVFEYSTDPINIFHPISREANAGVENPPIRLSYHGSVHYNSGEWFLLCALFSGRPLHAVGGRGPRPARVPAGPGRPQPHA